ncbi:MAG: hypothetical protein HYU51_16815 [Candidatus Rokubacteria bacterium]|nr:hypothetical protein [Candidatus Rokubacteria bacterium]
MKRAKRESRDAACSTEKRRPWETPFLFELATHGNLGRAAGAVGLHRRTVERHARRDTAFAEAIAEARREAKHVKAEERYRARPTIENLVALLRIAAPDRYGP